jgi:hypothetical protein
MSTGNGGDKEYKEEMYCFHSQLDQQLQLVLEFFGPQR